MNNDFMNQFHFLDVSKSNNIKIRVIAAKIKAISSNSVLNLWNSKMWNMFNDMVRTSPNMDDAWLFH